MRTATLVLFLSVAYAGSTLEPAKPIAIWPKGVRGETAVFEERDTTTEKSPLIAGRRVIRLSGVSSPTITVYLPPKERNTGAAVLVFPGGGYSILALDLEGTEVCEWLNSIGVTGVLLKYRVPARAGTPREGAPLQDAQRGHPVGPRACQRLGRPPGSYRGAGLLGWRAPGRQSQQQL